MNSNMNTKDYINKKNLNEKNVLSKLDKWLVILLIIYNIN